MDCRIYQPAKTAVSSGRSKTHHWLLEFEPKSRKQADRMIGWVGSDDTDQQICLTFDSKEAAIAFCKKRELSYTLSEPRVRKVRPKSYAENFMRRM